MCFACKLSWEEPSLWNPREQQGAQSHPRRASDCLRQGPSQFCSSSRVTCLREAADEEAGPMPSSHLEHFRTLPSDLGVASGEKWGEERAQRANAWVSLRRTEPNLLGTH